MIRTMRSRSTIRTATRTAALGALVIALSAGCGDTSGGDGSPADGDSDPSVSDGGEATDDKVSGGDDSAGSDTSDAGGADGAPSDGGTTDEGSGAGDDEASGGAPLPENADLATEQLPVPADDAVTIAEETAGGGETVSVSIDHDDNRNWVWEIEVALDGREHEIDIDAATGEVLQHEEDDDRVDEPAVDVTSPMTSAEAIDLALQKQDGRVSSWDLDSDDGTIRYQIDLEQTGDDDTEIEVDVETGEVRVED